MATPTYADGLRELRGNLTNMLPNDALRVFDTDAAQLADTHRTPLKLNVGDYAPDFELPDADGQSVRLSGLLADGPVVLTFYRGAWCPYCNLYLAQLQQHQEEIKAAGAQLVAVSPQRPDPAKDMATKNALTFPVLSDEGNTIAEDFTTVFRNGDAPVATMTALGFDFDGFYADDSRGLPVPATFVIGQDRRIRFAASAGGDYRQRVEPTAVLNALTATV